MRNIFNTIILFAIMFVAGACANNEQASLPNGTIRFTIGQAAETVDKAETRATPSELGKPLADKFTLTVQRNGSAQPVYDGRFVESMDLAIGTYDITARCGEDVPIGRDAPYYIGTAQAIIEKDKASSVVIPCRVGNALVSVHFGRDAEEKARFDNHFTDYGVRVRLGSHFMTITPGYETSSIYFPAGSSPELTFYGTLKSDAERQVAFALQSDALPSVYQAAEHGIVTLTLPAPESALIVEIGKAEVETVSMEQSIPASWLPIPHAEAKHVYDADGMLVGTDVSFSNTYPGATWKTVLTNADATVVRTVSGTGALCSAHDSSIEWPYLRAGEYTATYYVVQNDMEKKMGTRNFTIPRPELTLTVGGYTSYSKYLEDDINGANACDANTIYAPSVVFNVSEELLAKYSYTFECTYMGAEEQIQAGANTYSPGDKTDVAAGFDPYTLSATATFDGVTVQKKHDFYITGLPVNYTPPTEETWKNNGKVSFENDKAVLGYFSSGSQYIYNDGFAIPQGTIIDFAYNVSIKADAMKTTLSISLGEDVLFSKKEGSFIIKDYPHSGSLKHVMESNASQFKCHNSYGAGSDCSTIYSLDLKYAKQ